MSLLLAYVSTQLPTEKLGKGQRQPFILLQGVVGCVSFLAIGRGVSFKKSVRVSKDCRYTAVFMKYSI